MDASELARTLASLEAGELRAHKAAAVLSALPPPEAVAVLGELIRRADRRSAIKRSLARSRTSLVPQSNRNWHRRSSSEVRHIWPKRKS